MLDGEAEALWRTEIDLAKAGDRMLLRHCNDKILGSRRGQPVLFPMPPVENAADFAAAMGAVLAAAARGLITPAEAETLARAAEAGMHAVEAGARHERERLAEEQAAFERRLGLVIGTVLFYAIREIDEEAGDLDDRLRQLCKPVLELGRSAISSLGAMRYTPEWLDADRAFLAAHPLGIDRDLSAFGAEMARCCDAVTNYLDRNAYRIEQLIEEREARGEAAPPKYRTGLFESLLGLPPPPPVAGTASEGSPTGL